MLRDKFALETGVSARCDVATADMQLSEGDILLLGQQEVKVIATPRHTAGSISFLWNDRLFTGDS